MRAFERLHRLERAARGLEVRASRLSVRTASADDAEKRQDDDEAKCHTRDPRADREQAIPGGTVARR